MAKQTQLCCIGRSLKVVPLYFMRVSYNLDYTEVGLGRELLIVGTYEYRNRKRPPRNASGARDDHTQVVPNPRMVANASNDRLIILVTARSESDDDRNLHDLHFKYCRCLGRRTAFRVRQEATMVQGRRKHRDPRLVGGHAECTW